LNGLQLAATLKLYWFRVGELSGLFPWFKALGVEKPKFFTAFRACHRRNKHIYFACHALPQSAILP
jgi:hypothetical protein